jgi:hypothetical protein
MVDESSDTVSSWPQEPIPDEDKLFMRVHRQWTRNGNPIPGAFQDHGGGMSTNWAKYSTPEETLRRAPKPEENGVLKMQVGTVRAIPNQTVEHTPEITNRAHTDVFGMKDEEVRLKFTRICKWVVGPP